MRHDRKGETQYIEEGRPELDIAREQRHRDTRGPADIVDGDGDFGDGNGKAKRADREIGPAQSEHERTEDQRQRQSDDACRQNAEAEAPEIFGCREFRFDRTHRRGVLADAAFIEEGDLNDRRDIHPDPEEGDVAKGVVSHLAAERVPGRSHQHHHPQIGDGQRILREQDRPEDAEQRESGIGHHGLVGHIHRTTCRLRRI